MTDHEGIRPVVITGDTSDLDKMARLMILFQQEIRPRIDATSDLARLEEISRKNGRPK